MKSKPIFTTARHGRRLLQAAWMLILLTLCIPLSLFSQDFEMNGTVLVKYRGNAADVTMPEGVTSIGDYAFSECTSLAGITIPAGVNSIKRWAFSECNSLTSVTIPSSVAFIGYRVFYECANLTTVTVSRRTRIGSNAFPANARVIYSD